MNFITLVLALVLSQIITGVIGVTLVFNKRFAKWYQKKIMDLTTTLYEEEK